MEDEPLIALDLERLVTALGHRVVKIARTERKAIEAVRRARPGLILADIQLADGSSSVKSNRTSASRKRSRGFFTAANGWSRD